MTYVMNNESVTTVFVEKPLALPGWANYVARICPTLWPPNQGEHIDMLPTDNLNLSDLNCIIRLKVMAM